MKTMTLDEVSKLEISQERLEEIKNFKNTDFSDCPKLSKEELKQFKPWYELENSRKENQINNNIIHLDYDVLEALKAKGKENEKDVNEILRQAIAQVQ